MEGRHFPRRLDGFHNGWAPDAASRHQPDDAQDHRAFGRALRQLRHDAGLTQQQLADRVGIGVEYVSRLENGHRGARWHTVMRLPRALDATLADLGNAIERVEREN